MSSITYKDIQKRFFVKAQAHDLLASRLPKEHIEAKLCSWLHSSVAKPHVRKLFSSISLNDEDGIVTFEMAHEIDEETDIEFVLEVLGTGVLLAWVTQNVNRHTNMVNIIGTNSEKFYSPAEFMKTMLSMQSDIKTEQQNMIAERSGNWNSYLNGSN